MCKPMTMFDFFSINPGKPPVPTFRAGGVPTGGYSLAIPGAVDFKGLEGCFRVYPLNAIYMTPIFKRHFHALIKKVLNPRARTYAVGTVGTVGTDKYKYNNFNGFKHVKGVPTTCENVPSAVPTQEARTKEVCRP